jgi:hypothetical protein
MTKFLSGTEAECKVELAVLLKHHDVFGIIGFIDTTVAVGKLAKLGSEQLSHAVSIAATQVTSFREIFHSRTGLSIWKILENRVVGGIVCEEWCRENATRSRKRGLANIMGRMYVEVKS